MMLLGFPAPFCSNRFCRARDSPAAGHRCAIYMYCRRRLGARLPGGNEGAANNCARGIGNARAVPWVRSTRELGALERRLAARARTT